MEFETKGQKVGKIPVEINYRIIELFSAGLYSSPNKELDSKYRDYYYTIQYCLLCISNLHNFD